MIQIGHLLTDCCQKNCFAFNYSFFSPLSDLFFHVPKIHLLLHPIFLLNSLEKEQNLLSRITNMPLWFFQPYNLYLLNLFSPDTRQQITFKFRLNTIPKEFAASSKWLQNFFLTFLQNGTKSNQGFYNADTYDDNPDANLQHRLWSIDNLCWFLKHF